MVLNAVSYKDNSCSGILNGEKNKNPLHSFQVPFIHQIGKKFVTTLLHCDTENLNKTDEPKQEL